MFEFIQRVSSLRLELLSSIRPETIGIVIELLNLKVFLSSHKFNVNLPNLHFKSAAQKIPNIMPHYFIVGFKLDLNYLLKIKMKLF